MIPLELYILLAPRCSPSACTDCHAEKRNQADDVHRALAHSANINLVAFSTYANVNGQSLPCSP